MVQESTIGHARRVISGVDAAGRSVIVADEATATRVTRPSGAVVQEIWRQESLPAQVDDDGTRGPEVVVAPPERGVVVRTYTSPPDKDLDLAAYAAAAEAIYGAGNAGAGGVPGMHRTQTLDITTVLSGEIYAVFEEGETLLRVGDTVVVPGTMHVWSNRSDSPATLLSVVFPLA